LGNGDGMADLNKHFAGSGAPYVPVTALSN